MSMLLQWVVIRCVPEKLRVAAVDIGSAARDMEILFVACSRLMSH